MQPGPLRTLCIVIPLLALSATAVADTTTVEDNRNARANLFDIKSTTAGHKGELIEHTVRTYRSWRSKELRSKQVRPRMICIYVWKARSDPDAKQDYQVCSQFAKGKLRGSVWKVRPRQRKVAVFRVTRADLKSVTYAFDKKAIGNPHSYQWEAVTGFTGKGCPKDPPFQFGCDDSAPTHGVQVHDLRAKQEPPPAPPPAG
jgi:hypothetical protein